jgi:hypothetical protein
MREQPRSRQAAERELVERAAQDQDFRAELIRDPKNVIAREFDIQDMPEDLEIRVVEETPRELVIVLPPFVEPTSPADRLKTNTKWIFF